MDDSELLRRLAEIEKRLAELTQRVWLLETTGRPAYSQATKPKPAAAPPGPPMAPPRVGTAPPASRSSAEWETVLGGDWLNKLGVFVLVIGIALALGYSFTRVGPWGRIGIALAASVAMLGGGASLETRPRYRVFARGLLGGGWAALYLTVYSMHAVPAARVIGSALVAGILLLAVAAGMIAHSLRYRSQTVTGVAYFLAFVSLSVTGTTTLSVLALMPLAASLAWVARCFRWSRMALFGAAATYLTCGLRGDSGAPLWPAQAAFLVFWLLFEAFDVFQPQTGLAIANAVGFVALSIAKWHAAAPDRIWLFLAVAAALYVASAVIRDRRDRDARPLGGGWQVPATIAAGLCAAALFDRVEGQSLPIGLALEAEIYFLAGLRLRRAFLRWLAIPLFVLALLELVVGEIPGAAVAEWMPAAGLITALLYLNRALSPADAFYGYLAAGTLALIAGFEAPVPYRGTAWFVLAFGPFAVGWGQRLFDFRMQGYLLASLGALGSVFVAPHYWDSLVAAGVLSYTLMLCALRSPEGRFGAGERRAVCHAGSFVGTALIALLLYFEISGSLLTVAWGVQGVLVLSAGFPLRDHVLRLSGMALLLACIVKLFFWDLRHLETLPRIASFIVLGLILVGVSWLYTRFRERVERYF